MPRLKRSIRILSPEQILDNIITGSKLADGSVTNTKLADGSVTNTKLADGSVTNTKLADGSVTNTKLAGGSVAYGNLKSAIITKYWSWSDTDTGTVRYNLGNIASFFYPRLRVNGNTGNVFLNGSISLSSIALNTTFVCFSVSYGGGYSGYSYTGYAYFIYITASPPYKFEDDLWYKFCFIGFDKETGEILIMSEDETPYFYDIDKRDLNMEILEKVVPFEYELNNKRREIEIVLLNKNLVEELEKEGNIFEVVRKNQEYLYSKFKNKEYKKLGKIHLLKI